LTRDPEPPKHDLKGLVVRGVGWMMASQFAIYVLGLVTTVIVARLLGPREVGIAAEALVFGSLALVIVDFGFASAIVQRPTLSEADKSTAFWAGMVLGVTLTLVGVALSWPIASLYGEPDVQPLFAVLSLAFLFTAPGIVQGALLTRELEFRSLELRTIVATVLSCFTAIGLAFAGAGAWAIVAQDLVITGVSTVLLWRASPWRPRAVFSMASLRSMAAYTSHVFGTKVLDWGTLNLDNFLIGRFLGASALGVYTIAFSLMVTPVKRIAIPLAQVFFPAFSKLRDPGAIAAAWVRATRMLAFVVVPAMLGMIVVAQDLVDILFGDEWEEAVPVVRILATVGLVQALVAFNYGILQSLARTRLLFRFTLVLSAATVGAFAAGIPFGLEGVAWAYLIVTAVLQPVNVWITAREVGMTLRDWMRGVSGVVQAGVVMLAAVAGGQLLLAGLDLPDVVHLGCLVLVGAAVYLPLVRWRAPEVLDEIYSLRSRNTASTVNTAILKSSQNDQFSM
jgi:O-antigen/teichoic acid export membrane protein